MTLKELQAQKKAERAARLLQDTALEYTLKEQSTEKLVKFIKLAGVEAEMDEDRLGRRIEMATKSEYGRVSGLVNLLTSIVNFPTDDGSYDALSARRTAILDKINSSVTRASAESVATAVTTTLFDDIKTSKGYHTFVSDDFKIIEGIEPNYKEYNMLMDRLADALDIDVIDTKLSETSWKANESKAKVAAKENLDNIKAELERHNALHGDK